ncbi:MAG: 4-hydroxy-tetrahydrodipicolinate synthase [Rickettsiales bacterium]|nr:4-hydroxy-tetrahydrodipicolinate synthase [Rickettsiales bacterium]MCA0254549.1 4-hydroxy-tetrahydrodipicolinate synthase [Pseudomonadota bacterium]
MIYKGVFTAVATPFDQNDRVDYLALKKQLLKQVEAKVSGVVIAGSTGEGSSIEDHEYLELIEKSAEIIQKKIPIIAGVVGVSTNSVVRKIKILSSMNIDGIMCTVPHYIRPEQSGLYEHFKFISNASKFSLMIYLHPGRTGVNMSDDLIIKLSALDKIAAIKDCSSDMEKPLRLYNKINSSLTFLTGDDIKNLAYSANGGAGCVSVIANIVPKLCMRINSLVMDGDLNLARELHRKLSPLLAAIFSESNPIGIKFALSQLGYCDNRLILPLTSAREETQKKISSLLPDVMRLEENV